tara:strand:- start:62 stop:235 length:174 start_codon:yes stop_codon:yes gene_type:complete
MLAAEVVAVVLVVLAEQEAVAEAELGPRPVQELLELQIQVAEAVVQEELPDQGALAS